jgi:hypothetical protein
MKTFVADHAMLPDESETDDRLDDSPMLIDPPNPYGSMKSLRRFVKGHEGIQHRQMREVVNHIREAIARRERDPEFNKKIEARWDEKRAAALLKVPKIASDDDALRFAAGLIAEHGEQALTVAARERDALPFELGEEEAAAVWQRVVSAIIELRFDPAAEAAVLMATNNSNVDLAAQDAARRRDEAAAEGEIAIAKRWQRVIVQVCEAKACPPPVSLN